jgi:hypothetical protein
VLPETTRVATVGVDIGDWTGWWLLLASLADGSRAVVAYGAFDVKHVREDDVNKRLRHALDTFADETIEPGFIREGAASRSPVDRVWYDGNYLTDIVAGHVRKWSGLRGKYRLCRGAGARSRKHFGNAGDKGGKPYKQPARRSRTILRIGEQWYDELNPQRKICEATFNADHFKRVAQDGLKLPPGAPGSIVLPQPASPRDNDKLTNHFANERLTRSWKPGKGFVEEFERKGEQAWLDCLAMALAAAEDAGYVADDSVAEESATPDTPAAIVTTDWGALR